MKYSNLILLMQRNRSCRRFDESVEVGRMNLQRIIDTVRYCPSARNMQPIVYRSVFKPEEREKLFPLLGWAGYLTDWNGPEEGERPTAYLIQCLDTELTNNPMCDDGLQLESIGLTATALGFGCCIIKSFNPAKVSELLNIPERYKPLYIIAIGRPAEKFEIDTLLPGSRDRDVKNIRYWRDANGAHHVPKRPLEDLII